MHPTLRVCAGALGAALGLYACSSSPPSREVTTGISPGCVDQKAFAPLPLVGTSIPDRTLALTFDDGPSARTLELAAYLQAQGIPAAFFVNGMYVLERPAVLAQLVAYGHLVANHSQLHLDLTSREAFPETPAGDASLVAALAETDALITPFLPHGRRLFRAPFGMWDARAYAVLAGSTMAAYLGPIGWDIGDRRSATSAADWACWQQAPALTSKACGDLYLTEMDEVGRGIVLLHDGAYGDVTNTDVTAGVGNTFDMIKYMVPRMKAAGFTFVRLDDVPTIAAALPPLPVDAGREDGADAAAPAEPPTSGPPPASPPALRPDDPCAQGPRTGSLHAH